jgi:surface polysaccharide O-acyltransferase-like enzyme
MILSLNYFYLCVVPTLKLFLTIIHIKNVAPYAGLNLGFFGGAYGIYFIMGYLLNHYRMLKKVPTVILFLAFAGSGTSLLLLQYQIYIHRESNLGNYLITCDQMFNVIMALAAFELFRRLGERRVTPFRKLFTEIALMSFGIYLIHFPVMLLIYKLINNFRISSSKILVILFITTCIATYIIVKLLSQIPIINRLLLNIKKRRIELQKI